MIVTKGRKNIDHLSSNYGFQDNSFINRKQPNLKCQTMQIARQRKSINAISPISRKNIDNHRITHQTNQKKYDYSKDLGYSLNTSCEAMNDPYYNYNTYQTAQKKYNLQRPYQSIDRNVHLRQSKQRNQKPLTKEKFCLNQYLKQEFGNYKNSKNSAQINHYQRQRKNYDVNQQIQNFRLTDKLKEFTSQKNGYRKALQQTSLHSKAKYQSNHYRKRYKQNDQTLKQQSNLINQINKQDDYIHRNKQNESNQSNIQQIAENSKIDNQKIMEKIAKVNKLNQDINKILEKMMMKK